jgi:hypothetical protein
MPLRSRPRSRSGGGGRRDVADSDSDARRMCLERGPRSPVALGFRRFGPRQWLFSCHHRSERWSGSVGCRRYRRRTNRSVASCGGCSAASPARARTDADARTNADSRTYAGADAHADTNADTDSYTKSASRRRQGRAQRSRVPGIGLMSESPFLCGRHARHHGRADEVQTRVLRQPREHRQG